MTETDAAPDAWGTSAGVFHPKESETAQDWRRLAAHLAAQGLRFAPEQTAVKQFASGFGNLNYLIELDGEPMVLRRPPMGKIPPGANDMRREHTILSQLWRVFPLAPRSVYYTADESVLGSHFLIMEYRPGAAIGGTMPERLAARPEIGKRLGVMLVDILAALHGVDAAAIGLGEFGRPEGFLARAVAGWRKRMIIATDDAPPSAGLAVADWLAANQVPDGPPALLHNDFKLDNVLLDPATLEPVAVLDWDQGTRGDALFDLATLLSYWTEPDDPAEMHELRQMPSAGHGFPKREEVVQMYAERSGRDVSDFLFHRVLAMFKLAVVFLQIYAQYRRGTSTDERFKRFGGLTDGLLAFAHDVAMGRAF